MNACRTIAAIVVLALVASCHKNGNPAAIGPMYKGVVLVSVCTHTVIQTLGPNYLGENGWVQAPGKTYDHVFTVQNGCQVAAQAGDTISFRTTSTQVQNCMSCMVIVACPATQIPIEVVN